MEYEYFRWLVGLSVKLCKHYGSYRKLFEYLYSREFYSDVGNDCNRAEDGLDFRMRFAEGSHYTYRDVRIYLTKPCSVLEMMVALAFRCEEHIMGDPDLGDRTGQWLHTMLVSLNLDHLTDDNHNECQVEKAIDAFLAHDYESNGNGGLFSINHCHEDMRNAEIWYQMCWYLDELIE